MGAGGCRWAAAIAWDAQSSPYITVADKRRLGHTEGAVAGRRWGSHRHASDRPVGGGICITGKFSVSGRLPNQLSVGKYETCLPYDDPSGTLEQTGSRLNNLWRIATWHAIQSEVSQGIYI